MCGLCCCCFIYDFIIHYFLKNTTGNITQNIILFFFISCYRDTKGLLFITARCVLDALCSATMKFWVTFVGRYTLIQTEKFRMVLRDTVEKKIQEIIGPRWKKNSSLIVSWTIHFISNCYRLYAKEVRANDLGHHTLAVAAVRNPCTVCRPTNVCDAESFWGPSLLVT